MVGISIIKALILQASTPVDAKETVADQTERLAITYPYKGLVTKQYDTGQLFRYITTTPTDGSTPSNTTPDWEIVPTFFTGSGAPVGSKGVINDIWIDETGFIVYKKTGTTTWTSLFSISGSKIYTGVGAPAGGLGVNGDMYVGSNGDIYTKAAGSWSFQFSIKGVDGVSDKFATQSATSLDMSTVTAPLSITVGLGLAWTVGLTAVVASRSTPSKNLTGTVTSYNPATGVMILNPITPAGAAGAVNDWDVNVNGVPGAIGKAFIHTEADINFNDAKVTAVQGGTWTKQNPWSASVANDTRSSLGSPATLLGSKSGHSVAYDGTAWYDNGRWTGSNGAPGASIKGDPGNPGVAGAPGLIPIYITDVATPLINLPIGLYIAQDSLTSFNLTVGRAANGSMIALGGGQDSGIFGWSQTITCVDGVQIIYRGVLTTGLSLTTEGILSCLLINFNDFWLVVSEVADPSESLFIVKPTSGPAFAPSPSLNIDAGTTTVKTYPSLSFGSTKFVVPKIEFTFGGFKSGGSDWGLVAYIQYSSDGGANWFNLKARGFRWSPNTINYMTISMVDNDIAPNTSRMYRLTVVSDTAYRPSTFNDYLLYSVGRYL